MSDFVEATDENFDGELSTSEPIVLKFSSLGCGPCQGLAMLLSDIVPAYSGKVKFINVDVDKTNIVQKYGIRGIPTMLFIKNGTVVDTLVGGQPKSRIESALNSLI